jgi:hypothetical protein
MFCMTGIAIAAEPAIQWDSKDIIRSEMPDYKYTKSEAEYTDPKDGSNYGCMGIAVSTEPNRLYDRVLKRKANLSGKVVGVLPAATGGRVWIEDNYGRVIDQAPVKPGGFTFALDAGRSLKTGLYLKGELTDGQKVVWSGTQSIRMVAPSEDPWGDFILGVYNEGAQPGTGEMFRHMGLSHRAIRTTQSPDPAVQNDLWFHDSNILYSLLGLYHRDYKRWRQIQAAQKTSHGPIRLARDRCLSDPKEAEFARIILTAAAMRFRPFQPLHYSIGDEIGIGDMASPHDLCGCGYCMAGYRRWLKARYGTIDDLNREWDSRYKTFDDVEMMSNWQALQRAGTGNFAPWADRLEYMDDVMYGFVGKCVGFIRAVDPKAYTNISGFQQPSAWGFNHFLLSRTVNCCTPYEIGESPDVLMSFWNDGRDGKIHMPGFGKETDGLWRSFIRGYHIAQQWDSNPPAYSAMIDIDRKELTPFGKKVKEFADWVRAGPGRIRGQSERRRDPVAILYSQPSLRGNWILEMTARPDVVDAGEKWVNRGSWSVRKREMSFRVRVSWVQWMHDVGIWPRFVDASQVDDGFLEKNGYKVLVVQRAVAMSDKTAAAIRRFASRGGTVIADTWCGLMDEHCRMRPDSRGVLDDLFGVRRADWKKVDVARLAPGKMGIETSAVRLPFVAFERTLTAEAGKPGASSNGTDAVVANKVGKGRAIYLNFDMESYFLHRMDPAMVAPAKQFLLDMLAESGVKPLFAVTMPGEGASFHAAGHDVCVYTNGRGYLVGVMQNPTVMHSEVGGVETRYTEVKDNVFSRAHPARLSVPGGLFVYELTAPKTYGNVRAVEFTSEPSSGKIFACLPFAIEDLKVSAEVKDGMLKIAGKVATSSPMKEEALAVYVEVFRPDGSRQDAYCRTVDVRKGRFAVQFPLGLNEHGNWTAQVYEPCTGRRQTLAVNLP